MSKDGLVDFVRKLREKHEAARLVSADDIDRMLITGSLTRIYQQLVRGSDAYHREFGWTWAGFRLMNVLWVEGDLEIRELAERTSSTRAAVSSAVNTLETAGVVRRIPKPNDRRLVVVQITESGMAQLERAIVGQAELERTWLAQLSKQQRHTLAELLEIVADTMDDRTHGTHDGAAK
jgi:DNA-binding MarR family transcriptional regulator